MRFTFPVSITNGFVLEERFSIIQKLGKGGFGQVYKAKDIRYDNEVALKVEPFHKGRTLRNEQTIYDRLWQKGYPIGIPLPIAYYESRNLVSLAMPIYGMSLRDLWKRHGGLSMHSIGHIGFQMLNRLEYIHRHGIVHLDIKPENMMLGRWNDSKTVYLIDFGLAGLYRDEYSKHMPFREDVPFCGTMAFSSMYRDSAQQYSRRDDMESLMYSLVMLYKGQLPWCKGDWNCDSNYSYSIEDDKIDYRNSMCDGMPDPIQEAWRIVRTMRYAEKPPYGELRNLFLEAARNCTEDDGLNFNLE